MKKKDCEHAIRALCHQWASGMPEAELEHPSFSSFKSWLGANGYSHYLTFRSTEGPDEAAEFWFDQEFKQTWRR